MSTHTESHATPKDKVAAAHKDTDESVAKAQKAMDDAKKAEQTAADALKKAQEEAAEAIKREAEAEAKKKHDEDYKAAQEKIAAFKTGKGKKHTLKVVSEKNAMNEESYRVISASNTCDIGPKSMLTPVEVEALMDNADWDVTIEPATTPTVVA